MDQRIAIYVYERSAVRIAPSSPVDLMRMDRDDYHATLAATIGRAITLRLEPGVYGFVYRGHHGVSGPPSIRLVTDAYDLQRKHPWPTPPPPPPPPFAGNRDYDDHAKVFLVPLGTNLTLGADASADGLSR